MFDAFTSVFFILICYFAGTRIGAWYFGGNSIALIEATVTVGVGILLLIYARMETMISESRANR